MVGVSVMVGVRVMAVRVMVGVVKVRLWKIAISQGFAHGKGEGQQQRQ